MNYLLAKLKVKEIMVPNPITIKETATIGTAAQWMLKNHISGLPIVNETGALVL